LITSSISDVGNDLLLLIAQSACLFLPLPVSFSIRNSLQIGEFRIEKSHFLGG
jgi:hypothetical protein